jgi:hypothetical protein
VKDGLSVLLTGAFPVRVFDAKNQNTPLFPGQKPVEESGPGSPYMEIACGGWGKAYS